MGDYVVAASERAQRREELARLRRSRLEDVEKVVRNLDPWTLDLIWMICNHLEYGDSADCRPEERRPDTATQDRVGEGVQLAGGPREWHYGGGRLDGWYWDD